MICSDLLSAENVVRVVGLPSAVDVDPVTGQTVAEADRFESLTFAGLFRGDDLILQRGETVIEAGDRAVVIGSPESVQAFASEIGYQTARLLEERSLSPRIVERDHDRARELAETLPNTLVMEHDATDTEFLAREHVDEADIVVAALELKLTDASERIDRSIEEVVTELEADVVFGAITRNRELITPRGDTELYAGDHIVVSVEASFVEELTAVA